MAAYLLNTLLLLTLIAGSTYLLLKGLLALAKDHINERFRYMGCIAMLLLFLLPFYQLFPAASMAQRSHEAACISALTDPAADLSTAGSAKPPIFSLSADTQQVLLTVWLLGAVLLGAWYLLTFRHFRRKLFQGTPTAVCDALQQLAEQCARECGVRQKPILRALPEIQGPMLIGFFQPIIAVPANGLPLDGAALILTHELIHFKRHDLWWKVLGVVVRCIHWFDPLVWLLARELEFYAETSCDAQVVAHLDHDARKRYGYLLISYIPSQHDLKPMPGISFTPARRKLQRRLSIMLNGNRSKKLITSVVVGVLAASSLTLSAFAAENQPRIPLSSDESAQFQQEIPAQAIDPNNRTENRGYDNGYCRRDGSMPNGRNCRRDGSMRSGRSCHGGNSQRGYANNNFAASGTRI